MTSHIPFSAATELLTIYKCLSDAQFDPFCSGNHQGDSLEGRARFSTRGVNQHVGVQTGLNTAGAAWGNISTVQNSVPESSCNNHSKV